MIALDIFGKLPERFGKDIIINRVRHHSKASEAYIDATFIYGKNPLPVSIPVNYRRTGVDAKTAEDCRRILAAAYASFNKTNLNIWNKEADIFWARVKKKVTKSFFDTLRSNLGRWVCQGCEFPPNPNWARRTQDIKELGYTFSTNTRLHCKKCKRNRPHLMLLPIKRGAVTGYETWSPMLRNKILKTLGFHDAYENATKPAAGLQPDHKFPEIRWDEKTRSKNPDHMIEKEIEDKFQLITNQRNQQKREVCRACYQTGIRGKPFGVNYFYSGDESWPQNIPKNGKAAESGCIGCGWYDLQKWRIALNQKVLASAGVDVPHPDADRSHHP